MKPRAVRTTVVLAASIVSFHCIAQEQPETEKSNTPDEVLGRVGRITTTFYSYRPSYFGYTAYHSDDDAQGQLKFQLSLKYEIAKESNFFFGYTQKSFWSIQKTSAPFEESNFAPEFFYLKVRAGQSSGFMFKSIQTGAIHESSGEGGSASRGWNRYYVEPTFLFYRVAVTPKLWAPLPPGDNDRGASDNPDIYRYYGYGELVVVYRSPDLGQHSLLYRRGQDRDKHGFQYQLDIKVGEIRCLFSDSERCSNDDPWGPKLFVQWWSGYGESLKNYNRETRSLVVGISAIR